MGRFVLIEELETRTLLSRALGIDVASYQGSPTWSSVAADGVQFMYAKATQGNYYIDPDFAGDMSGSTNAGIVAGAYDFADWTVNPTTEANYFLATAKAYVGPGYLRPMLDVEASTSSNVSSWVNTWCNAVYSATGVKPIIYTYQSFAADYLDSSVTQWPLWMASPNGQNPQTGAPSATTPWSTWALWQYDTSNAINGISGDVDQDVANGDMTSYVIPNLVAGSTQFKSGQVVHVNASGGLKAWNTYASNGTYVTEPNNTNAIIEGGPVYISSYLRYPVKYAGSSTITWSAGNYLAAGGIPVSTAFTATPSPTPAGSNVTLSVTFSDPDSAMKGVAFYRESNGVSGLQTAGDTYLGAGTPSSGQWSFTTFTSGTPTNITYYAVATDVSGNTSAPASLTVNVASVLPAYITPSASSAYTFNSTTSALNLTTGTLTFTADNTTTPLINLAASGSSSKVIFNTREHLAGLTLSSGASAAVLSLGSARTHSNHNVLVIGTLGASTDPTFSVDSGSKLDLEDNDLIVHTGSSDANGASAYASVADLAEEGRNPASGSSGQPDGQWNGNGLSSSAAASADASAGYEQIGLAVVVNSSLMTGALFSWQVGSFDEPLGANDIIVKYDYLGDYALEGEVSADDAGILQMEYDNGTATGHTWATGSSLYDGLSDNTEAGLFQLQYGLGTGGNEGQQL